MTREPGRPWAADVLREGNEDFLKALAAKQVAFSTAWEEVMRRATVIRDRAAPFDWRDPAPQTLSGTSDAITKLGQD